MQIPFKCQKLILHEKQKRDYFKVNNFTLLDFQLNWWIKRY